MANLTYRVRLYFIRHAESEANLNLTIIGGQIIPSPLSPLGNEQAVLLGKRLKYQNTKFDYIFSSTAVRAQQTANIALEIMGIDISKLITSEALLEQSQGMWEGLNRQSCYTDEIVQYMNEVHMEFSAPNGESLRMVQKRGVEYLEPIIEQAKQRSIEEKREISIVIFTHANFIRSVLQYYLESIPRHAWLIGQNNTAITEILFNRYGTSLVKVNDSGHLTFLIPELSTKE
jgi:broad specificity phosphatase PhoE